MSESDNGAIVLVIKEGVEVEVDAVQRADAPEAMPHITALRPQHRLVRVVRIVLHELHLWNIKKQEKKTLIS
jgi:hypothetical protein